MAYDAQHTDAAFQLPNQQTDLQHDTGLIAATTVTSVGGDAISIGGICRERRQQLCIADSLVCSSGSTLETIKGVLNCLLCGIQLNGSAVLVGASTTTSASAPALQHLP